MRSVVSDSVGISILSYDSFFDLLRTRAIDSSSVVSCAVTCPCVLRGPSYNEDIDIRNSIGMRLL